MQTNLPEDTSVQKNPPLKSRIKLTWYHVAILIIVLAAIFSRLLILGERVMSHDEINHVYFAYQFFNGGEYQHNPLTHGPLQFHLLEWSYFLFGASDFTARIPSAFFSVITVLFIFKFKRYLGRLGTIAAAALFVISPYMLYYGRYARNEAIAIFFTVATAWAVLRYLDNGENKYLYLTAAFTALHFTTKETAFIFTAEMMIFLGILFLYRVSRLEWKKPNLRNIFFISLLIVALLLVAAVGTEVIPKVIAQIEAAAAETDAGPVPFEPSSDVVRAESTFGSSPLMLVFVASSAALFLTALVIVIIGFGWKNLIRDRAFGMILFQLTLVFPQLSAFPAFWLKLPVSDFNNQEVAGVVGIITGVFLIISIILGGAWEPKKWLVAAGIYYGLFLLFYTSIFTNMGGVYSGMVGSLGYWLEQQGVERGSQPWYYFTLVQIPLYEYLALLGTFITGLITIRWARRGKSDLIQSQILMVDPETGETSPANSRRIALFMFLTISVLNLAAYSYVGEKMPWLTVHLTWSMWLLSGWLIGNLLEKIKWPEFTNAKWIGIFTSILAGSFALFKSVTLWIAPIAPFSGKETPQLEATGEFLAFLLVFGAAIFILIRLTQGWQWQETRRVIGLTFLAVLSALTIRHAALASYKNYDLPNEYLVYAHAARGPKDAMEQIESISLRTTGSNEIMIAFDNHAAYPFWWYLRDYPNRFEYFENPTRDLRNYPLILAGEQNYHLLEPIIRKDFVEFEYPRMVWPNQDYFNLDFYSNYLSEPTTRGPMLNALLQIWLNRDFSAYSQVTGQNISIMKWNPSQRFTLYVRKDVASQVWQYGAIAEAIEIQPDIYAENKMDLAPLITLADLGLNGPKDLAVGPDNTLYITDTGNNRVVHLSQDHQVLHTWGTEGFAEGQFTQPWGIAVDSQGYVFVTDTWNHRVQKFTADGEFVLAWGEYGQGESAFHVWGPRGIDIDLDGNVIITDTGNKRVIIYTADGELVQEFGGVGYLQGQFDEPVGVAISPITNQLFIADTWNQRIQVFANLDDTGYQPILSWDIDGWYGQNLDNKPFITADTLNRLIIADPESARILVYGRDGEFLGYFGDFDPIGQQGFGVIGGLSADDLGGVWISDSTKNEIKYFQIPNQEMP